MLVESTPVYMSNLALTHPESQPDRKTRIHQTSCVFELRRGAWREGDSAVDVCSVPALQATP